MKSHLKFFLLWLIWISATSCSQTYYTQVFTTQSPKLMKSNEGWFYETDSIKIVYDFFHAHGKMNFTIYNKQKSPIYIDWQNSSFTNNGFNNTYWNETRKSTKMKKTEPITTIPPKSIFSTDELDTTFNLVPSNNFKIDELKATKLMKPSALEKNKLFPALSVSYDEDESIIAFRNRLAIAYKKNQFTMVEHKFYVENLLEIHKSCFDFEKYNDKTKFYIDFIKKQNAHNP